MVPIELVNVVVRLRGCCEDLDIVRHVKRGYAVLMVEREESLRINGRPATRTMVVGERLEGATVEVGSGATISFVDLGRREFCVGGGGDEYPFIACLPLELAKQLLGVVV